MLILESVTIKTAATQTLKKNCTNTILFLFRMSTVPLKEMSNIENSLLKMHVLQSHKKTTADYVT